MASGRGVDRRRVRGLVVSVVLVASVLAFAGGGPVDAVVGPSHTIDTIAGGVGLGAALETGSRPAGIAYQPADPAFPWLAGTLYVSDSAEDVVRKIDLVEGTPGGVQEIVAGNGTAVGGGDGGPATAASLRPRGLDVDDAGNLFIADVATASIRRVDATTGIITTVVGGGGQGYSPTGTPVSQAVLGAPMDVAVGFNGDLFIADSYSNAVQRVTKQQQAITIDATGGTWGLTLGSDTIPASDIPFDVAAPVLQTALEALPGVTPGDVAVTGGPGGTAPLVVRFDGALANPPTFTVDGSLLTGGSGATVEPSIITLIGDSCAEYGCTSYPRSSTTLSYPSGVSYSDGMVYVADTYASRIQAIAATSTTGVATTAAGTGSPGYSGDGGPATAAKLFYPMGVEAYGTNLYIADTQNNRIRAVAGGTISTFSGTGNYGCSGDGGSPLAAQHTQPVATVSDGGPGMFVADSYCRRVRHIVSGSTITSVEGNGRDAFSGDDGPATDAQLSFPNGLTAVDRPEGAATFVADSANHRVRKVDSDGTITTVAGGGPISCSPNPAYQNYESGCFGGFTGDGGAAVNALLSYPSDVAVSGDTLFIADTNNRRIRAVDLNTGLISTYAGTGGYGSTGDGGPATAATFGGPDSLAVDAGGNLYISDPSAHRVRMIDAMTGTITTFAGTGGSGSTGDGGPATAAQVSGPQGLGIDSAGRVYILEGGSQKIRVVESGTITTFADLSGQIPSDLAVSPGGKVFATTAYPQVVEVAQGGVTTPVAGIAGVTGFGGDGGPATDATLWNLRGITVDPDGSVQFTDGDRIRVVYGVLTSAPDAPSNVVAAGNLGSVDVSWVAPGSDGGSPITGYVATASPGGASCSTSGDTSCSISGLTPRAAYTVSVVAQNAVGDSPASAPSGAAVPWSGSAFRAVTPFRAVDSRPGPDNLGFVGPIGPGQSRSAVIAGTNGIPASASALVMNVTVTGGTQASYLTVFPTGTTAPTAASLLFGPGQTVPNMVTAKVGAGGAVSFFNQLGNVQVIADVVGYYDDGFGAGPLFKSASPQRLLDSRDLGSQWAGSPLGVGETKDVMVHGQAGVPASATAVVMNVTATGATQASYLQAFPSGAAQPVTANLLFGPGQTVPNLVTVGIGGNGKVSLFNQLGSVHVIADVMGWYEDDPSGARFHAIDPTRVLDSRDVGAAPWTGSPVGQNASRSLTIAGKAGVPTEASVTGLVANATVTGGTKASYLSVGPKPGPVPAPTANLLFGAGQTAPNAVVTGLGATPRAIDIYNQLGSTHVIIDAAGYFQLGCEPGLTC